MDMNLAKSALTERFTEFAPLSTAAADYDVVRRAIAHIRGNWRSQPEIDVIANAAGVSATDLHHLFRRWCGLTPKAFLQALTLNSARELLRSSASILDTAYEVGLSGPGRLHDLFVTHEAMSPGEWKAGGEGLTITYGFHPCPFGMALVMTTPERAKDLKQPSVLVRAASQSIGPDHIVMANYFTPNPMETPARSAPSCPR